MRIRLLNLWDVFRGSFWFLPTILVLIAIVSSLIFPWIDQVADDWIVRNLPWLTTSRDVALMLLNSIASSMITVAGIVFSLTVLILSNASSAYGSRVMRRYMQDPVTQFAIGAFVAPSLYCLLVLRHLGHSPGEVPHLSVSIGVAFAVFNFGMLIYFVHHVALAIQSPQIIHALARELATSIETMFPEQLGSETDQREEPNRSMQEFNHDATTLIPSNREGYLQVIDDNRLMEISRNHKMITLVERRPGDFITQGQSVFRLAGLEDVPVQLVNDLNDTLYVGTRRTPRQDVECAVHELVEVAVRALSPGINDPFTAITCIDYLSASLAKLAQRKIPDSHRLDRDGELRVIAYPFTFKGVIDSSFNQIRQCGSGTASVLIRLMERLTVLATMVIRPSDRQSLQKHAKMVRNESQHSLSEPEDLKILENRYDEFRKAIAGLRSVEVEVTVEEE